MENFPRCFPPVAMFSAFSRSRSRSISTGGSVVRSSNLTEYRSTTASLIVIPHGCSAGFFPPESIGPPFAPDGSADRPSAGTRRRTFVSPPAERRTETDPFAVEIPPIVIRLVTGSTSAPFRENSGITRNSSFSSRWRSRRSDTEATKPESRNSGPPSPWETLYPDRTSRVPPLMSNRTASP